MPKITITNSDLKRMSDETEELFYEWLQRAIDEHENRGRDPEEYDINKINMVIKVEYEVKD
jgi:hypothetical protein